MGQIITRRDFLRGLFTTAVIAIPSTKLIFDLAPQSFREIKELDCTDMTSLFKQVYGEYSENLYSEELFVMSKENPPFEVKYHSIPVIFGEGPRIQGIIKGITI